MQTLVRGSTKPATVRLDGPMKPSPLSLLLMSEHQPATAPSGGTTPPAADATESASPATTETPVADVVAKAAKDAGKSITLTSYVRFQLGEGIEKEVSDFAAEVAAAAGV